MQIFDCLYCRTALQLPPGARTIRCAVCHAITPVRVLRPPPPPPPPLQHQPYGYGPSSLHHQLYNPSPYNHVPLGPLPAAHGCKRAVICGIAYWNSDVELEGCINDAKCMKYLLINRFKFPESSILMLTEEENDPYRIPTKRNIRMALRWLVQGCQPGDSLVFHFSGHGGQQRNDTGDEIDGFDETLSPLDFRTEGDIVDDEINATIVGPIPHGVKLHAIIDACHSGTMLDLPFLCKMDRKGRYIWEDHSLESGALKGTSGGKVFSFSGCDDHQESADASDLSGTGAMTFSFFQATERSHITTYGDLLNSMRSSIRKKEKDLRGGVVTTLLNMLSTRGSLLGGRRQEPQLTASKPFDVYTKHFLL